MCELMGMSFAEPISADFSLHEFGRRGDENADGWGLGWYPDSSLALVKEPLRWHASTYTSFLESYQGLLSPLYIAHVRHKTMGGHNSHCDTQPFMREFRGREYCYAHNGTIPTFRDLPLGRFRPIGGADSEHLFCTLMDAIAQHEQDLDDESSWSWLHQQLSGLNRFGTMNILLADSKHLFAYHDMTGHKGLCFRKIHDGSHESRHFEDVGLVVDLNEGAALNHGFIVASEPLSTVGWQRFQRGELLVIDRGVTRWSSHRDRRAAEFEPPSRGCQSSPLPLGETGRA